MILICKIFFKSKEYCDEYLKETAREEGKEEGRERIAHFIAEDLIDEGYSAEYVSSICNLGLSIVNQLILDNN